MKDARVPANLSVSINSSEIGRVMHKKAKLPSMVKLKKDTSEVLYVSEKLPEHTQTNSIQEEDDCINVTENDIKTHSHFYTIRGEDSG